MELSGKIKLINDIMTFDSGFQKREFVVTTQEQYPQDIKFELVRDRVNLVDGYQPGDDVNLQFDIRGNEFKGRYYVNLQAWRIEKVGGAAPQANAPLPDDPGFPAAAPPAGGGSADEEDDLPF